jgi:hypothetical protein
LKHLLFYILFLCFSLTVFSKTVKEKQLFDQEFIEQKKFNKEKIERYKKNEDFIYILEKREPTLLEKSWKWCKRVFKKILSYLFDDITPVVGLIKTIIKTLPYLVAVLILYLIIKFFLKVNAQNILGGKVNKPFVIITDDEVLIKDKNLPKLIQNAVEDENYNLAIRYYYMLILKKLVEKGVIRWQQEKTNEDYIREINSHKNISNDFKELTLIYDYAWYGEFKINNEKFLNTELKFKKLMTKI